MSTIETRVKKEHDAVSLEDMSDFSSSSVDHAPPSNNGDQHSFKRHARDKHHQAVLLTPSRKGCIVHPDDRVERITEFFCVIAQLFTELISRHRATSS